MRLIRRLVLVWGWSLYLGAWAFRIVTRKYYVWLPGYVSWSINSGEAGCGPGPPFFLLCRPLRAGTGRGHDGALGERLSQRSPHAIATAAGALRSTPGSIPRSSRSTATWRPCKSWFRGGLRRNRTAPAPRQRYAGIRAPPVRTGDRLLSDFRFPEDPPMEPPTSASSTATGVWITATGPHSAATTGNWRCCASWAASPTSPFPSIFNGSRSRPPSTTSTRPRMMTGRNPTLTGAAASRREAGGRPDDLPGSAAAGAHSWPATLFLDDRECGDSPGRAGGAATRGRLDARRIHVEGPPGLAVHQGPRAWREASEEDADEILGPRFDSALTHLETALQRRRALHPALRDGARGLQPGAGSGRRKAGRSAAILRLPDSTLCGRQRALRLQATALSKSEKESRAGKLKLSRPLQLVCLQGGAVLQLAKPAFLSFSQSRLCLALMRRSYIPGFGLKTNWSDFDSPAATVIFWVDVPSFSCQAVMV